MRMGGALDPVTLGLFAKRVAALCEEMGAVLRGSAFSPNIRDRLDYSCAVFDPGGELIEQSAAVPVHLGSMAFAMSGVTRDVDWRPGRQLVFNDPFKGGTHLPDVTVVSPIFVGAKLIGFAANRAHHADIGAAVPGSMPLSRSLAEEGCLISPTLIPEDQPAALDALLAGFSDLASSRGDFAAQLSANRVGCERIATWVDALGGEGWRARVGALAAYAESQARAAIASIPDGTYQFADRLDDDGAGNGPLPLRVRLVVAGDTLTADFSGTAAQVAGNVNCPLAVTAAGVYFVLRCLMPPEVPHSGAALRPIELMVPRGCMLNAEPGAAVAAGNVETSMRVVDTVAGALAQAFPDRLPAAGQGTMNNIAMGARAVGRNWDFYETVAGGGGGGPDAAGASAVHTHMTNTLNTPIEVIEQTYPLRIRRYAIRRGSGGAGRHPGGDGLVREFEFLDSIHVSLISERRTTAPWGLAGGGSGARGKNLFNGERVAGKVELHARRGDVLTVMSPGGGGWGLHDKLTPDVR